MAPKTRADTVPFTVLFAGPSDAEYNRLREFLDNRDLLLLHAHTSEEALRCLRSISELPVVIADSDLPSGGWSNLLRRLESVPNPPRLVVSSRLADERLWAEVLNMGGFDVLATPFCREEVKYVVENAQDNWCRSHERDHRSIQNDAAVSSAA